MISNKYELPLPYVRAVSQLRERKPKHISVTQLIQPAQLRGITLQHLDELHSDAIDRWEIFFGNAIHELLSLFAGPMNVVEEELTWIEPTSGWTITGTPDYLELNSGELYDWKTTRTRTLKYDRDEWEQQLNLYAYLLRQNGHEVRRLSIWAFLRDWDPQLRTDYDYPRAAIVKIPQPLWNEDYAREWLHWQLAEHIVAEEKGLWAPCTDEERWKRPTYAVWSQRDEAKRPSRVFEKASLAEEWVLASVSAPKEPSDWYRIEERPGEPVRCKGFCPAAPWCEQWAAEQEVLVGDGISETEAAR